MKEQYEFNVILENYLQSLERLYDIATDPDANLIHLRKLSKLSDSYILTGLSLNPSTPEDILLYLFNLYSGVDGQDAEMRIHILSNSSLSSSFLERVVTDDKSKLVRETALKVLETRNHIGEFGGHLT